MAVIRQGKLDEDLRFLFKQKSVCFLCGDLIKEDENYIYWSGNDGTGIILLHKHCAASFACHLISDFTKLNTP